jgi:hypothetical protein
MVKFLKDGGITKTKRLRKYAPPLELDFRRSTDRWRAALTLLLHRSDACAVACDGVKDKGLPVA